MAITWRNIEGGNQMVSMMGMRDAQRSMTDSFQGLQGVLKQYQGQEKANWDAGKEQNTQAFLDRLSQVRTPEELAALQASGQLDRERAQFGAQIDRSAVRNALDTREDFLRQQATNKMAYDNQARDFREADLIDNVLSAYARGDFDAGDKLREGQDFRNDAHLSSQRTASQRGFSQEQRSVNADKRAEIAASQQTARFGWEADEQKRIQEELAIQRNIDRIAMGTTKELGAQEQQRWETIKKVAGESGLALGNDGLPVFDPTKPEQAAQFAERLQAAGVTPVNPTAQIKDVVASFLSSDMPGVSPKHVKQLQQQLFDLGSMSNELSPEDAALLSANSDSLTTKFTTRLAELDQKHAREREANPYLEVPVNVEEGVLEVLTALPKDFDPMGFNASQKEMLANAVEDQLRNGMPVAVAKLIVSKVGDSGAYFDDIDDFFNQEVQKLEKSGVMKKGMEEAETLSKRQEAERAAVSEELTRGLESLKKTARKSAGVSPSRSDDYLKGLSAFGGSK